MSLDEVLKGIINVNWPEKGGIYKVVQFMIDETPYIRFWHEIERGNHASIVKKFIDEKELGHREDVSGPSKRYYFTDEERHQIIGAGWCDLKGKKAEFFGASTDYEIIVDEGHLLNSISHIYPNREITYNSRRLYKRSM